MGKAAGEGPLEGAASAFTLSYLHVPKTTGTAIRGTWAALQSSREERQALNLPYAHSLPADSAVRDTRARTRGNWRQEEKNKGRGIRGALRGWEPGMTKLVQGLEFPGSSLSQGTQCRPWLKLHGPTQSLESSFQPRCQGIKPPRTHLNL